MAATALVGVSRWQSQRSLQRIVPAPLKQQPNTAAAAIQHWPRLTSVPRCNALQRQLASVLGPEQPQWSITVADQNGTLWADLHGLQLRKPASTLKLITSAIALDRMGDRSALLTSLWQLPNGRLRLLGQGDPDLFAAQWRDVARRIAAQAPSKVVDLEWLDVPRSQWWAPGWTADDRFLGEGPPITRLALGSNLNEASLADPVATLQRLVGHELAQQGKSLRVHTIPPGTAAPEGARLIWQRRSLPLGVLLDQVNSESQNYTAEVLLRQATGRWSLPEALKLAGAWMRGQGLDTAQLHMVDGSGLAHDNRITSRLLVALLLRMSAHRQQREYFSSMAVVGQKGTLQSAFAGWGFNGVFRGKTGSLTGVRNTTGYLQLGSRRLYVAMLTQDVPDARRGMALTLDAVRRHRSCLP